MPRKKSPNHVLKLTPILSLGLLGSSAFSIQSSTTAINYTTWKNILDIFDPSSYL
jgi:hypothetical protein